MLWLAGIMGLVGVGAASFAVVGLQDEDEDEDLDTLEQDIEGNGDLLEQLKAIQASSTPGIFSMMKDGATAGAPLTTAEDSDYQDFDTDVLAGETETSAQDTPDLSMTTDEWDNAWADDPFTEQDDDPLQDAYDSFAEPEKVQNALVGDWINQGGPSEILDYETGKESLMLVWDDMAENAAEPSCEVTTDPYDAEVKHVMMNGKSVAEVYGDPELSAKDVTVIPLSSALIAGLEPAPAA